MRICVIGSGYVGSVAGTCFADSGNDVVVVDSDAAKIARFAAGEVPFYEPGLSEMVQHNVRERRLRFDTQLAPAVKQADVAFIAVGTPEGAIGDADVSAVLAVAESIGRAIEKYTLVVTKSTVPVGTCDRVRHAIAQVTKVEFDVASNPEFLKEGAAIEDFQKPDRIVVGCDSDRGRRIMEELYAPFVRTGSPVLFTDPRSAEFSKYACNAMLATRISFMNEMAQLAERVGADADAVRRVVGSDKRIGPSFLFPGVGWGGSCFGKDIKALIGTARSHGLDFGLLASVEAVNERMKRLLVQKAREHFSGAGGLRGRRFAVWGLSFKPRTDDMRAAPSIAVVEGLLAEGAQVVAHDPVAEPFARRVFGERIAYVDTPYAALEGADALFLVTEWNEFRNPDFDRMKALLRGPSPVVFDGRNVYDPARMRARGFTYYGIGRA
jgi:UDPglucose 6-dehydrogenase